MAGQDGAAPRDFNVRVQTDDMQGMHSFAEIRDRGVSACRWPSAGCLRESLCGSARLPPSCQGHAGNRDHESEATSSFVNGSHDSRQGVHAYQFEPRVSICEPVSVRILTVWLRQRTGVTGVVEQRFDVEVKHGQGPGERRGLVLCLPVCVTWRRVARQHCALRISSGSFDPQPIKCDIRPLNTDVHLQLNLA